jgi:hypothetical protein
VSILKNKTWRKKMHETKLLKLLGISLIVGILGLTGFCKIFKDNNDNNDLALGAGLLVAQQQAEQAAYEAANNTDNPQWFCAHVIKNNIPGNSPTYQVTLTPLVAQDCNVNYWGFSTNAIKQRLLETIDNDTDLSTNCTSTRSYISGLYFSSIQEKFIYVNGSSLLSEVGLSTTTYTVVSPNTFKVYNLLLSILYNAQNNTSETTCQTAVSSKLNSIPDNNTFCLLSATPPNSTCPSGQTKVVSAQCAYGDIDINNDSNADFRACATLDDQF